MKKKFTDKKQIEETINLYKSGNSILDIGKKYNCHASTIFQLLKKNNIATIRKSFFRNLKGFKSKLNLPVNEIVQEYKKGYGCTNLAKKYKASFSTIIHLLRKNNVEIRSASESAKLTFKLGRTNPMQGVHLSEESIAKGNLKRKKAFLDGTWIPGATGKIQTLEHRKKHSATHQGIKLEDWKSFKSFEPYNGDFNIHFKNQIRKRDNQVCMNCGIHREKLNQSLEVHHINYDKQCSIEQNGLSLCKICHGMTNFNRSYWTQLFQEKLSKLYGYKYQDGKIILNLDKSY